MTIIRSKCGPEYKKFASGVVSISGGISVFLLFTSLNIIPPYCALGIGLFALFGMLATGVFFPFLFPFNVWNKVGETLADQTAKTYGAILSDPITRTSLLYHMRDLLQEER